MGKLSEKEIEARIAANRKEPRQRINNTLLLKETGLRVVHIRPGGGKAAARNGMTVAFRPTDKPVVEVATALCKNGDTFSRKMGTRTAIENFQEGHTIFLPLARVPRTLIVKEEGKPDRIEKFTDYPIIDTLTAYFTI